MVSLGCLAALGCCRPKAAGSLDGVSGPSPVVEPTARMDAEPMDASTSPLPPIDERTAERERMVERQMRRRGIENPRVLAAMRCVPRHRFVPVAAQAEAYADRPLPIGHGQTISQPYIVAVMTELAEPEPDDRCLEIGTGSGYQAAVLAEICAATYSVEYLPPVAELGEKNLRAAGYGPERVRLRVGDGYAGWPEAAPFDVIVVTAAPETVPEPLLDQLAVAGRLVIPVGGQAMGQELQRWTRRRAGRDRDSFEVEELLPVRFVPFLGDGAAGRK